MRILMSGSHFPDRLPAIYARELNALGCDIELHYNAWEKPLSPVPVVNRIARRIAPSFAWHHSNERLVALAESFKPDVILLFKGMDIYPRTLRRLRATGALLANYNADHPLAFFSRGTGNANVAASIPFYDLHLTYSRRIAACMNERFPSIACVVVPFGHDVDDSTFEQIRDEPEINRVCFLGNADDERAHVLGSMAKAGLDFDVYGHGWDKHRDALGRVVRRGPAIGLDMLRAFRGYRVHVNLLRPHNEASHNMRSFEIPACGGIMLGPDTLEHRTFFVPGSEAFLFRDSADAVVTARHLLAMETSQARALKHRARTRSVRSGYHYRNRAIEVLRAFEDVARVLRRAD